MPTSAVVDASVLVSAFLFPKKHSRTDFGACAARRAFAMHISPLLLDETRPALLSARLRNAYGHEQAAITDWCTDLQAFGGLFSGELPEIDPVCRDPNDDHVIATALAIAADIIVTGDKDLLALGRYRAVRILTARDFLIELEPDLS